MKEKTYLNENFWAKPDGDFLKIGLTKEALHTFEHIEWIELPKVSQVLLQGSPALIIESSKAAIDIDSPLSGTVVEVNEAIVASPKLLEEAPEEVWLFRIFRTD